MAQLEAALLPAVVKVNEYLSNYILVFLLIGVGLWYTIKTRFVQVRCFGEGMKKTFGSLSLRGGRQEQGMSSFQALATAIAAQVGTGNIVGASGAILTGGPGAIFWMWIIAFFGMATIYAEATLALQTRKIDKDGTIHGGPVYYITTAFKGGFGKFLAGFFAVAIILALGFMGCMVQSNSIGSTFNTAFGVPNWIVGVVLVVICGIIFLGGVQRLASVTENEADYLYYTRKLNSFMMPIVWQPHFYLARHHLRVYLEAALTFSYNFDSSYVNEVARTNGIESWHGKYTFKTVRDNRWGYGLAGGGGFAVLAGRFEVQARVRYYFGFSDIVRNRNKYADNTFDGPENPFYYTPRRSPVDNLTFSVGVSYRFNRDGFAEWNVKRPKRDRAKETFNYRLN